MNVLDNRIKKILAEAGLSQSERTVYLVGGSRGLPSSTFQKKTGFPRATVMAALKTLRDQGLCETYKRDGRSLYYVMLPLVALRPYLGQRLRHIDELLEEVDSMESTPASSISTQEASGQEQVIELLEYALRCNSRRWRVIAPKDNALAYLPDDYGQYFKRIRTEREIRSKTLWEESIRNNSHLLPDIYNANVPCLLIAFDDSLLMIEGTDEPSCVLIQSKPTVRSFELVFEMAWRSVRF